jgi:hypothetical protein
LCSSGLRRYLHTAEEVLHPNQSGKELSANNTEKAPTPATDEEANFEQPDENQLPFADG